MCGYFKEFEQLYMNQRYSEKSEPEEISNYIDKVLPQLFSPERAQHIASNPLRILHIVSARNLKLLNGHYKIAQDFGLLSAAVGNLLTLKIVETLYLRVIISPQKITIPYVVQSDKMKK